MCECMCVPELYCYRVLRLANGNIGLCRTNNMKGKKKNKKKAAETTW